MSDAHPQIPSWVHGRHRLPGKLGKKWVLALPLPHADTLWGAAAYQGQAPGPVPLPQHGPSSGISHQFPKEVRFHPQGWALVSGEVGGMKAAPALGSPPLRPLCQNRPPVRMGARRLGEGPAWSRSWLEPWLFLASHFISIDPGGICF